MTSSPSMAAARHSAAAVVAESDGRPIVQVVPYYPPHLGGIEVVAQQIAEGLAARHKVEVLTTTVGARGAPRYERAGRVVVRRLCAIELAHTPVAAGLAVRLLRVPRTAIVHVHVAQALTPEVVWLTSVARRRPFVAHYHGGVDPYGRLGWLLVLYQRHVLARTLRAAARVLVLSGEQSRQLQSLYHVDPANIVVLPNGVGPQFGPSHSSRRVNRGSCRLLFVGRLSPQKALPRLIQALVQMTEPAELVIVGEGEDAAMVRELVRELALSNVRFAGVQRGDDLVHWYQWADVFVLPSDREGMPLAMLEAMAVGLPIVATDVPGSRETLGNVGLLVEADPGALAAALDRIASDPGLRADLSSRSLRRAREYSWPRLIERLEGMYAEIGTTPRTAR